MKLTIEETNSSAITKIVFEKNTIFITYKQGSVYAYDDPVLPEAVGVAFTALTYEAVTGGSLGKLVNKIIKPSMRCVNMGVSV